jgi:uncharacterized cupin superfamily protein
MFVAKTEFNQLIGWIQVYRAPATLLSAGRAEIAASIDVVDPGKRGCPYHFHHAQEELFIVLEGCGTLRVAGELLPIQAGDTIFLPAGPEYPHQIINTSDQDLKYLGISTCETPEIVEYPDSGKYSATARHKDAPFPTIQKAETSLDYWEGEP